MKDEPIVVKFLSKINLGDFWTEKEIREVSDSISDIGGEIKNIYENALKDPIVRLKDKVAKRTIKKIVANY